MRLTTIFDRHLVVEMPQGACFGDETYKRYCQEINHMHINKK